MPESSVRDPAAPAPPESGRVPRPPCFEVLRGQPALVTGAGSGIGMAVALEMAQCGADIVVNYD